MSKAKAKGSRPQYIVRARQDPDNDYMQTVGAAWCFKEGDGYVVKIHSLPVNWNGDLILVVPKDD